MPTILAADIGATNCRFALFRAEPEDGFAPPLTLEREVWLKGADYPGFADALRALVGGEAGKGPAGGLLPWSPEDRPALAVIAPAGPVLDVEGGSACRISNLAWTVDSREAEALLGINRVFLINDFAAQAYACLLPQDIDAVALLPGQAAENAPCAVAGAGTGFGKALLLRQEAAPGASRAEELRRLALARILPSEGGHAEFPFIGKQEADFAAFATKREGRQRLIFDDVVTGKGLGLLVSWLTGRDVDPPGATALAPSMPEAMEYFARFYGRGCRLYVLETLALGGLFITGGMALRVPVLEHPAFAAEFVESSMEKMLRRVPVWHVRKPQAGLWGAALYGLLRLGDM